MAPTAPGSGSRMADGRRLAYRALRGAARLVLALFYRRVEVVGGERLPARGPVLVASNHQNALVDAMLLVSAIPRPLRPLAKAPLFAHPLVGPLLRLTGAIPVRRRQDEGTDRLSNEVMFGAARQALRAGEALLIFPEGVSQPEPLLMPLRTGAARILLEGGSGAEPASAALPSLVPVGLVYHEPGRFRTGWALVLVGAPLAIGDCAALAATAPKEAVQQLTARLGAALRRLIVEAGDRETLRLMRVTERIWRAERDQTPRPALADRAEWRRRVARAHRHLAAREPARLAALRAEVDEYARDLERAGIHLDALGDVPGPRVVTRYLAREGLALGVGLPLGVAGIVYNAVPYGLTALGVHLLRPEPDTEATYKILGGLLIYPACWAVEAGLAWAVGGAPGLAVFLLTLVPASLLALGWAGRLLRVRSQVSSVIRLVGDHDLRAYLLRRRRQIGDALAGLVREVPESVLEGEPEDVR
jgi:glycerol-3-phosphate O-acyltransferase/dihydroxyacetone phosphate acyltransferase